jgi:hypothetical protein
MRPVVFLGVVRRYESIGRSMLDVTSLFPASSLPAPLPAMKSDPETPTGARGAERSEGSAERGRQPLGVAPGGAAPRRDQSGV